MGAWGRSWGGPRLTSPLGVEAEAETEAEAEVTMGCVWALSALPNSGPNIGDAAPMAMPWPCHAHGQRGYNVNDNIM